jgi:hypothetical protein
MPKNPDFFYTLDDQNMDPARNKISEYSAELNGQTLLPEYSRRSMATA